MQSKRLDWLDAARGCALALLCLCLHASAPEQLPAIVKGAALGAPPAPGPGFADLLMPLFLLLAGASLRPALREWRGVREERRLGLRRWLRVARRVGLLLVLGLFLNAFPQFELARLRLPGPLQLIALAYLACLLLALFTSARVQGAIAAGLLLVHAGLQNYVAPPGRGVVSLEPGGDLGAWLDRALLGARHLGAGSGTTAFDTLGPSALPPAVAFASIGYLLCQRLEASRGSSRVAARLAMLATLALAAGWALGRWVPIQPSTWSLPFALIALGLCVLGMLLWRELVVAQGWIALAMPFRALGRNAILVYVGSLLFTRLTQLIHLPDAGGEGASLWDVFADQVWRSWASAPTADWLITASVLALWWTIAGLLSRRRVYITL